MIRRSERDAEEWDKPLSHISRPLVPAAEHAERLLVGGSAAARLGWADGAGRLLVPDAEHAEHAACQWVSSSSARLGGRRRSAPAVRGGAVGDARCSARAVLPHPSAGDRRLIGRTVPLPGHNRHTAAVTDFSPPSHNGGTGAVGGRRRVPVEWRWRRRYYSALGASRGSSAPGRAAPSGHRRRRVATGDRRHRDHPSPPHRRPGC